MSGLIRTVEDLLEVLEAEHAQLLADGHLDTARLHARVIGQVRSVAIHMQWAAEDTASPPRVSRRSPTPET